jgi:uncharacterized membrane protein
LTSNNWCLSTTNHTLVITTGMADLLFSIGSLIPMWTPSAYIGLDCLIKG